MAKVEQKVERVTMTKENGPGYSSYSFWGMVDGKRMQFVNKEEYLEYLQTQTRRKQEVPVEETGDEVETAEIENE